MIHIEQAGEADLVIKRMQDVPERKERRKSERQEQAVTTAVTASQHPNEFVALQGAKKLLSTY